MILRSKVPPPFLPDVRQSTILEMGLKHLNPSQWMIVDEDASTFLSHKLEQKTKRPDQIYQALPESKDAQFELNSLLEAHLIKDHNFRRIACDKLVNSQFDLEWVGLEKDLWSTSLWIQEDICLLEKLGKHYILTAASVCSPSNWDMPNKIGKCVSDIHKPVPGYKDQISDKVDRLMRSLKPEKPLARFNWSIQPHGDLFWKTGSRNQEGKQNMHWRVERQTLMRLPQSKAIVFGIRVFIHDFSMMSKIQGFDESVAALIRKLPAEQSFYKNLQ